MRNVILFKLLVAIGYRLQIPWNWTVLHIYVSFPCALKLFLLARLESEQEMLLLLANDSPVVVGEGKLHFSDFIITIKSFWTQLFKCIISLAAC